ncbi:MAG: hypothetical protein H6557_01510 [Lewinellaceae bacterium]|nr:hypothetical protein [Lewinellaceae bacterium]
MTNKKLIIACIGLGAFLYLGCGGSSSESSNTEETVSEESGGPSDEPKDIQEAMNEVQKASEGDGEKKEVVDFRELKKLLPEKIAGMERTHSTAAKKAGAMGFNMSTATAEYREGDKELEVPSSILPG